MMKTRQLLSNKKKAVLALSASLALVLGTTLAIYTAKTESDFAAVVGTVDIDVHSPALTNQWNINPGDNDPKNPAGAASGTDHELSYTVTNYGSKSVRTRHSIILTIQDKEDKTLLLDARVASLYKDGKEVGMKDYILENGLSVPAEKFDFATEEKVKAVRYSFLSDAMDGYGKDLRQGGKAEKEDDSLVVHAQDNQMVEKTYVYDFALDRTAGNEYQKAVFTFDVFAEGIQYRNTDDTFWLTFYTDQKGGKTRGFVSLSSAEVATPYVPNRSQHDGQEDGNGKEEVVLGRYPSLKEGGVVYDFPIFEDRRFNFWKNSQEQKEYAQKLDAAQKADFEQRMAEFEAKDKAFQQERFAAAIKNQPSADSKSDTSPAPDQTEQPDSKDSTTSSENTPQETVGETDVSQ